MRNAKNKSTKSSKAKPKIVKESVANYGSKTSRADAKGRLVLGPAQANKTFRVTEQSNGDLLLEPVVVIHEREAWLFKNPKALAMVKKGMAESRAGRSVSLGSFAKYADLEIGEKD